MMLPRRLLLSFFLSPHLAPSRPAFLAVLLVPALRASDLGYISPSPHHPRSFRSSNLHRNGATTWQCMTSSPSCRRQRRLDFASTRGSSHHALVS
ncbi:hypothetical protein C8R47DRAFT_1162870 [Mycena vitilis]|nr:hypothetical protein C8R47DRAFT_1162870 [Mycena vitilis]